MKWAFLIFGVLCMAGGSWLLGGFCLYVVAVLSTLD